MSDLRAMQAKISEAFGNKAAAETVIYKNLINNVNFEVVSECVVPYYKYIALYVIIFSLLYVIDPPIVRRGGKFNFLKWTLILFLTVISIYFIYTHGF